VRGKKTATLIGGGIPLSSGGGRRGGSGG